MPVSVTPKFDPRTEKNLATLTPKAQKAARALLEAQNKALAHLGLTVRVLSGTRTAKEQAALYAQGRSAASKAKKEPIVTNARAWESWHNWGLAFDIGIFKGTTYITKPLNYMKIGVLAKAAGLEWGGDWSTPDLPHYQLRPEKVKGMKDAQAFAVMKKMMEKREAPFDQGPEKIS